jgi:uncharacterized protein YhaN
MTRTQTVLALLAAAVVAWGCGKTQTGQPAALAPNKSLEARVAKLEQDLKAVQTQAAEYESRWRAEQARSQAAEKERDALRADLTARTTERDNLQAQYDSFRKNLKELLGQAEAAQALPPVPAVPAGEPTPSAVSTLPAPRGL